MATTTQITTLDPDFGLTAYAGDHLDDFDMDAVRADYLDAINAQVPAGVWVAANGMVFAEVAVADEARAIDWSEIGPEEDAVAAIFQRHDVSTTTEPPR